eukprot:315475-Prorocentrum_lima.AAC.1
MPCWSRIFLQSICIVASLSRLWCLDAVESNCAEGVVRLVEGAERPHPFLFSVAMDGEVGRVGKR